MADFTPNDERILRSMHVSLEDPEVPVESAVDRLYNTLATAYQRLDEECARAHVVARTEAADAAKWKEWARQRGWALCVVALVALAEALIIRAVQG